MFPLLSNRDIELVYLTLEVALNQALVEITEVSEGGHVPDVKFDQPAQTKVQFPYIDNRPNICYFKPILLNFLSFSL